MPDAYVSMLQLSPDCAGAPSNNESTLRLRLQTPSLGTLASVVSQLASKSCVWCRVDLQEGDRAAAGGATASNHPT